MAEEQTLTMDESNPESGQFSEEEMDSLRVGEEMEEQTLLAGKYENAQELEKAYVELEKKLGGEKPDAQTVSKDESQTEEKTEEKSSQETTGILDKLWEEKESGFTDDTLKELASTNPGELAKSYLKYRLQNEKPKGLSTSDVNDLKGTIGGEQEYSNLISWAESNMSKEEQAKYDAVIDNGDPTACYFAIQYAYSKYKDAVGTDGQLLTGKAPSMDGTQFKSQAQLVAAMGDPRYDSDPAYRREAQDKLARSNVNF